jgi:hypothetical protein
MPKNEYVRRFEEEVSKRNYSRSWSELTKGMTVIVGHSSSKSVGQYNQTATGERDTSRVARRGLRK